MANEFSNRLADLMAEDIGSNITKSGDVSNPMAKYNESTIQNEMQLRHIVSDSYQMKIFNLINDLYELSASLKVKNLTKNEFDFSNVHAEKMTSVIGNGPSNKPNISNLAILADSVVYKRKYELLFDSSRAMRHNFMEKYHQPFVSICSMLTSCFSNFIDHAHEHTD